jgi:hypothetical protein
MQRKKENKLFKKQEWCTKKEAKPKNVPHCLQGHNERNRTILLNAPHWEGLCVVFKSKIEAENDKVPPRLQLHKEANNMTSWWEPQQESKQNKFEAKKTALFTVSNYAKKHIAQHHVKQFREKVCKQQDIITFKRKARMLSPVSNTAKKTPMLQRKKQLDMANGASLKSFMSGGTKQTQEITKAQRALATQTEWETYEHKLKMTSKEWNGKKWREKNSPLCCRCGSAAKYGMARWCCLPLAHFVWTGRSG